MSENLVVASKVKAYIKKNADMNTSASVMEALSRKVEQEIHQAVENAKRDRRRTVMDRDIL